MTIQKVGNSINYIDIYIFTMTVLFIKCSVLYVTLICWPAQLESSLTTIPVKQDLRNYSPGVIKSVLILATELPCE